MSADAYVYILTNYIHSVLYIGITNNILRRIYEHKYSVNPGFTATYHLNQLVYLERFNSKIAAINREKQLKHWKREWKEKLINTLNPEWKDLSVTWDFTSITEF